MIAVDARDVVILGSGPAGCAAALYGARDGLRTLVVEKASYGGQIVSSPMVENYPGISTTDGYSLMETMRSQAEGAGAEFITGEATRMSIAEQGFVVSVGSDGLFARSVIACVGSEPREAGFEGESRFRGRGVSYCGICDAMFYRNKLVFVCGGGNSAAEEALMLADLAKEVYVVVRKPAMRAEKGLVSRLERRRNIRLLYETQIAAIDGNELPASIQLRNLRTGDVYTRTFDEGSFGVFVYVGRKPSTGILQGLAELDASDHVVTDDLMRTRTPGLFAAGDCRSKDVRQIVTAVSDGAIAAINAGRQLIRRM